MDPSAQTTSVEFQQPVVPLTPGITQDPETAIAEATPLADTTVGEISPAADQSNRGAEIAARMAPQVTPVKTIDQPLTASKLTPEEETIRRQGYRELEDGTRVYVDPEELEEKATEARAFPTDNCLNCLNHGKDSALDEKGFCSTCGFKLNRVRNIGLEPSAK